MPLLPNARRYTPVSIENQQDKYAWRYLVRATRLMSRVEYMKDRYLEKFSKLNKMKGSVERYRFVIQSRGNAERGINTDTRRPVANRDNLIMAIVATFRVEGLLFKLKSSNFLRITFRQSLVHECAMLVTGNRTAYFCAPSTRSVAYKAKASMAIRQIKRHVVH